MIRKKLALLEHPTRMAHHLSDLDIRFLVSGFEVFSEGLYEGHMKRVPEISP